MKVTPENMRAELARLLHQQAIFSLLDDEDLDWLAAHMDLGSYSMGENIIREGESGHTAYLVFSGRVRILKERPGGASLTVGTLGRGSLFGEQSILDEAPRNATVRAAEDVVLFTGTGATAAVAKLVSALGLAGPLPAGCSPDDR